MIVLDASALLALLYREPGHDRVATAIRTSPTGMSAVNLAEVLGRHQRHGFDPAALLERLNRSPIEWSGFGPSDAVAVARLEPGTRSAGLSLGDRTCIALAIARDYPAMTADRRWATLTLPIPVDVTS